jgi:BirA family biotin operon repressor/biotin-[acetyl-CoA-carboxylase] ligase
VDRARGEVALLTIVIRTVAETGSTNADLLELARTGAAEGLWLRAERQTGGRGRQGRAWESPSGNLYASTLIRLRPGDPPAATLALVSAVALCQTIDTLGAPAIRIKWPNDLMIDGAKVAGILLEREGDAVVIGTGVNIAHHPDLPDRPTASLEGRIWPVTIEAFLDLLSEEMRLWVDAWRQQGLKPVIRRWLQMAHEPGTALRARLADGTSLDGLFAGLDSDGALILRLADGTSRVIHAADVFLI